MLAILFLLLGGAGGYWFARTAEPQANLQPNERLRLADQLKARSEELARCQARPASTASCEGEPSASGSPESALPATPTPAPPVLSQTAPEQAAAAPGAPRPVGSKTLLVTGTQRHLLDNKIVVGLVLASAGVASIRSNVFPDEASKQVRQGERIAFTFQDRRFELEILSVRTGRIEFQLFEL